MGRLEMELYELYRLLEEKQECRNNCLAVMLEGEGAGSRYLFSEGNLCAQTSERKLEDEEEKLLSGVQQSQIIDTGEKKFFAECLKRPAHLVICGAGHVSQQVIKLAKNTGFFVTVLEDRPMFAGEAVKAGADQVICDNFENGLKEIKGSLDTYFLVVTRGHRYDRECLESILSKPHRYVGMMASRGRAALLKKQMEEDGTDRRLLDAVHTPVGLAIHAETPEEIAVSIVAELIREKNSLQKTAGYEREVLDHLTGRQAAERKKVLATIIKRRGSAPRGIGTKMLVLEDGRIIGTIGGGCMESEVQHICLRMLRQGSRSCRTVTVDMTASQAEEEGLVCGGTIEVFLEILQ